MGGKNKKKNIGGFSSITARYFLEKFCGVSSENAETMNHAAIKDLLPSLKRTSYAHVLKNPELVATRQVVIVSDSEHHVIPYIVPENPLPQVDSIATKKDKILDQIVGAVDTVLELSESTILLIECNSSIHNYLAKQKKISDSITSSRLANSMIEANYINSNIMINFEGKMYTYENLEKDVDESSFDFFIDITSFIDLMVINIEKSGIISVIVNGEEYYDLDLILLKKWLSVHYDNTKENKGENTESNRYRLEEISEHKLEELMKLFKHSKQNSYYHTVRRELVKRRTSVKHHKIEKAKQKIKDYGDGI